MSETPQTKQESPVQQMTPGELPEEPKPVEEVKEDSADSGDDEEGENGEEVKAEGEGEGDEVAKKRKKKSNNKKKRKRNKQKAAAAAALEAASFNIEHINVFVPTGAPEAEATPKTEEERKLSLLKPMPKAPAMASPTTGDSKSFNVDAPSFVFDPSKAFTALPASNLPTKDKKKKAKNPEQVEVTEERTASAKRSRNRKKAAAAAAGEVQATEYKAKAPSADKPQAPIPMPQPPQPTQAVKSGYTNRHKQAATETSAVDEEKARITAEKEVRAKKVYSLDFMLTLKNDNKLRPVNMALLDFPHKKRRAEFRKMPLSEVDKFN